MKKQLVTGKRLLLFIDTGDNCRCPLARGYLTKLLRQRNINYVEIKTAGVMTPTGLLPTPEVVQLLNEEGEDIKSHRSKPLTNEMIRVADLILGMTPIHVQKAIRMTEEARGKTFLLKEYVGTQGRNVQIPDPMGGTMEIFKKCFSDIRQSLQKLVEMEFVSQPPEAKEMVVVDTTPIAARPADEKPKRADKTSSAAKAKDVRPPATKASEPKAKPTAKPTAPTQKAKASAAQVKPKAAKAKIAATKEKKQKAVKPVAAAKIKVKAGKSTPAPKKLGKKPASPAKKAAGKNIKKK